MSVLAPLRPFVEALTLDSGGVFALAGTRVATAVDASDQALARALMPAVYRHAYTRSYPAVAVDTGADRDLTAELSRAGATRARGELGWTLLEHAAGGGVIATRGGRARRFEPGQFVALDGSTPPPPGTALAVQFAASSATRQPGFHYFFSEGFRDAHDLCPLVRFYWNVRVDRTTAFARTVTATLNRYRIPFDLKVATRSVDFARTDNSVLYLARDAAAVAWLALAAAMPALAPCLRAGVPLFALELADGVGFAEDPGNGESFGSSRSGLVAAGLLQARVDGGGFDFATFADRLAAIAATAGLSLDALWRNPGPEEHYPFAPSPPSLPPAIAA